MPTYLERYLAGEREAVWSELTSLGTAIAHEPLAADAHAVARETMRRARANVELLAKRLTALGYRFIGTAPGQTPAPHSPPNAESLADLREVEKRYGLLPLSLHAWYSEVGAVDFMGVYPRLSAYEGVGAHGYIDMMMGGERIRIHSLFPFYTALPPDEPPDADADLTADPLVVWPCLEVLVDELDDQYSLGFAPDALTKANTSGGDGPHMDFFAERQMDAPLGGDDWDGVPFITYLRTAFAWGGFPALRDTHNPPRELLAMLCEGLLPL